jgi:hypothetical protein
MLLRVAPQPKPDTSSESPTGAALRGRTLSRLKLGHAIGTLEVLITVALSVLVPMFLWMYAGAVMLPEWSALVALAAGILGVATLLGVAMWDPEVSERAVRQDLGDRMHVADLRDPEIKRLVMQVITHRARMERQRLSMNGKIDGLETTLRAIDRWVTGIGRLVQVVEPVLRESHSHSAQKHHLIDRIAELEARIATSSNRTTSEQLRETMAARRMQFRAIEELETQMENGLLRIENAVSALGALDAKLAMLGASDESESEMRFFAPEIKSEIAEIDSVIAAMHRVYSAFPQESRHDG